MVITSHAVGAVVVRLESDGRIMCAQMEYVMPRTSSFRHMMETGENGRTRETVIETLRNGLHDEVAADKNNFEYRLLREDPILIELGGDQKHHNGTHLKTFFLVEVTLGELRQEWKPDGDAKIGPVKMAEIRGVIALTEGKTVPIHARASKAAVVALATDRKIFDRYSDIVLAYEPSRLTTEELAAIKAYSRKW